jgi:predicted metal-binding protein
LNEGFNITEKEYIYEEDIDKEDPEIKQFITEYNSKIIQYSDIVWHEKVGDWCKLSYPEHPKGCPNYGKSETCPPNAPFLKEKLKQYEKFTLYYIRINYKGYIEYKLKQHPDWTLRNCRNVNRWQSSAKKYLRESIPIEIRESPNYFILWSGSGSKKSKNQKIKKESPKYAMESVGINVMSTFKQLGLDMDIKAVNMVTLVNLVCYKKSYTLLDNILSKTKMG